ncbi:glycosyl transferase family 1 [Haloprofundus marisrubri]|uniref:Glycosyl transferase family 1 n=1 Tax=Haloprofundus marisrubri TaxID=1514971 RepID=A0A0W1RAK7_9EURY|nr:glycosyltransferase [Haloprofundus marisrubri]KTG09779.1 glycosyl transferase family 1 [Haloprofundus marisrubri]
MRVAFVSMLTTHHEETPATRRTRRTIRFLQNNGHEVAVLCAQWWGGDVPEFEHEEITYRRVTEEPSARGFASKLPFALRKVGADVIHAANRPPGQVAAAKTAGRFLRTPVVVDWWDDTGHTRSGYRRAAKRADLVVAPSQTVKTQVREYGASESDIEVVPECIDTSLVDEVDTDERAQLVYARRLDEHANVESFLLSLAELRDRDWSAAVVGDGPERERAERTARDLRIDDRVTFLGALSDADLVSVLKGAHVFVQTAEREPCARNLLWALACGCISVVEYQVGSSAHELVEGRERGSLATSPQEIAERIAAAGAFDHWTVDESFNEYDCENVLGRYVDCYERVVDGYGLF